MLTGIRLTLSENYNKPIFPKNFAITFLEATIKNIGSIMNTIKNINSKIN